MHSSVELVLLGSIAVLSLLIAQRATLLLIRRYRRARRLVIERQRRTRILFFADLAHLVHVASCSNDSAGVWLIDRQTGSFHDRKSPRHRVTVTSGGIARMVVTGRGTFPDPSVHLN